MRVILRGAAIGLLAGALFFFVPFFFRLFFFFLLISIIIRLVWGGRRRGFGPGYRHRHFGRFNDRYDGNPISIDGSGFRPPVKGNGGESNYPVL